MILILYSGGNDSQRLMNNAVCRRLPHAALHFYSADIPKINAAGVRNMYVLGASDTTENCDALLKQNHTYMNCALGYASGIGAREIQVGIIEEDFEEPFLRNWLSMFLSNATFLAKQNGIMLTLPLLEK